MPRFLVPTLVICSLGLFADAALAQSDEPAAPALASDDPALLEILAEPSPLARADRLLAFARRTPPGAAQARALDEAQAAVQAALSTPGSDPVAAGVLGILGEAAPAARVVRIEALAALGDPRVLPPLAYLARRDPEPSVRIAGFRALGAFRAPEVERAAESAIADRTEKPEVRAAAATALGAQHTLTAEEGLVAIVGNNDLPAPLRQAAVDSLLAEYPARAQALKLGARVTDSTSRFSMLLIGAASGGYTLGTIGALAPDNAVAPVIGTLGGVVIGAVAGQLLGTLYDVRPPDALLLASYGVWSVPVGSFAGSALVAPGGGYQAPITPSIMLLTHLGAMTAGWLVKDRLTLSETDVFELNASAAAALFVAGGLVNLPPTGSDARPALAALALAPTLGLALGTYLAPTLQLTAPKTGLALLAMAEGGLAGGLLGAALIPEYTEGPLGAPNFNVERGHQITGLSLLGIGLGAAGVLFTSPLWDPSGSDVALIGFGALAGNMLFGALPLLVAGDAGITGAQLGVAAGGLAGGLAASLLTRPLSLELRDGDPLLLGLGSAFSAWQGIGWASWLSSRSLLDSPRASAFALAGVGAGTVAFLAATRSLDLSMAHAGWLFSGSVWGAYLSFLGSLIGNASGETSLLASLIGSDVGFALSALVLSPLVNVSPAILAWSSIGGFGGTIFASLAWAFANPTSPGAGARFGVFNLVGTTLGLGIGAALGATVFKGSGGDAATLPLAGLDLPLPMITAAPMVGADGAVSGGGAQLLWRL
jgi:hypothetical protein